MHAHRACWSPRGALAHSLNANKLHKWVIDAERAGPLGSATKTAEPARDVPLPRPTFIPLALT